MRQEVQGSKKIGDNLGYYLLLSFVGSILLNYLFSIEDKITGILIGFFFLFAGCMFYLRYIKYKQINEVSGTGISTDLGTWNIVGKTTISNIKTQVLLTQRPYFFIISSFSRKHALKLYLKFMIILESSYNNKEIYFRTHLYKDDLPKDKYYMIYNTYNILEKIFLLPMVNKSQKTIEKYLKERYDIYIGKEVVLYQNPNDPDDIVMEDLFK